MQAGDGRPSYDELAALVIEQARVITELRERVTALEAENAELKRRLGMDSTNSSKPPSSDSPFTKPTPKSLRRKSGRKPGGRPGHPGSTLALVDNPNKRLRHEPGPCGGCGADLADAPEVGVQRRQVFDLPPMAVQVTEHQLITRRCACGATTCGTAPEGVGSPVQYGPRVSAIILYLYVGQFLSKKRTAQALAELFGTPVCEATVARMTMRAADCLAGFLAQVKDRVAEAGVAGFDETGLLVAGTLHWVHCARTDKYTVVTCHPKRGKKGIDDAGVLGRFHGVAVHDAWAPYDTYADVGHQLCCAHALRELAGVADTAPSDALWCWAGQASDALVAMQKLVAEAIATEAPVLDQDALGKQVQLYRSAVQIGITQTAARTGTVMKKHNALARRLLDRQDDYLRFTTDWRIPADNNGSERDIRMIKLRQKVSGCLRTLTGAKQFCAIRSYLSTAAKHGKQFFEVLVMLAEGRPWLPAIHRPLPGNLTSYPRTYGCQCCSDPIRPV
ncbi:IS66 family transposase [Saccharopolyspora spinosa]|uniref:Transposase IS66-like protein n=1 Tax=Saccharopolyspora spinosa TaxID=60894 RepID=A0A2N3XZT8_SACSN|nr:IS66 family transposase [Saccharopolyspora spinosa]PKW16177.1 transposase IS66-like protein [Saccharopolyspora spinosa]